jgi:hypothetical protein
VLSALVYLLLRRVVWLTAGSSNELLNAEVELVVLRHQLKVHKRQVGRGVIADATGFSWPRSAGRFRELGGRRS